MSRPKPSILLEKTDSNTFKSDQILEAEVIWAVFYKGKPFVLRTVSLATNYPAPVYKKVTFSSQGHAKALAKKLNEKFKCNDFEVFRLFSGEKA